MNARQTRHTDIPLSVFFHRHRSTTTTSAPFLSSSSSPSSSPPNPLLESHVGNIDQLRSTSSPEPPYLTTTSNGEPVSSLLQSPSSSSNQFLPVSLLLLPYSTTTTNGGRTCMSLARIGVWTATIACVITTGLDLYFNASENQGGASIFLRLFVIGSYTLLAVLSFLFVISRWVTVRSALARLPKLYVPISASDGLPSHVYTHIAQQLIRSTQLVDNAKPLITDTSNNNNNNNNNMYVNKEWGEPGTPLEGVHFGTATIKSVELLRTHLQQFPLSSSSFNYNSNNNLRIWLRSLVNHGYNIDLRVANLYIDIVERAYWSHISITMDQYLLAMKLLALLLSTSPDLSVHNSTTTTSSSNSDFTTSHRKPYLS